MSVFNTIGVDGVLQIMEYMCPAEQFALGRCDRFLYVPYIKASGERRTIHNFNCTCYEGVVALNTTTEKVWMFGDSLDSVKAFGWYAGCARFYDLRSKINLRILGQISLHQFAPPSLLDKLRIFRDDRLSIKIDHPSTNTDRRNALTNCRFETMNQMKTFARMANRIANSLNVEAWELASEWYDEDDITDPMLYYADWPGETMEYIELNHGYRAQLISRG